MASSTPRCLCAASSIPRAFGCAPACWALLERGTGRSPACAGAAIDRAALLSAALARYWPRKVASRDQTADGTRAKAARRGALGGGPPAGWAAGAAACGGGVGHRRRALDAPCEADRGASEGAAAGGSVSGRKGTAVAMGAACRAAPLSSPDSSHRMVASQMLQAMEQRRCCAAGSAWLAHLPSCRNCRAATEWHHLTSVRPGQLDRCHNRLAAVPSTTPALKHTYAQQEVTALYHAWHITANMLGMPSKDARTAHEAEHEAEDQAARLFCQIATLACKHKLMDFAKEREPCAQALKVKILNTCFLIVSAHCKQSWRSRHWYHSNVQACARSRGSATARLHRHKGHKPLLLPSMA